MQCSCSWSGISTKTRALDAFREVEDEPSKMVAAALKLISQGLCSKRSIAAPIDCNDSSARLLRLPPLERRAYRSPHCNQAVSYVTGSMPRRYQSIPKSGLESKAMLSPRPSSQRCEPTRVRSRTQTSRATSATRQAHPADASEPAPVQAPDSA